MPIFMRSYFHSEYAFLSLTFFPNLNLQRDEGTFQIEISLVIIFLQSKEIFLHLFILQLIYDQPISYLQHFLAIVYDIISSNK